ncbi:MAG: hemolysin III family protein [Gemmatimonadaceae bacterium]|nr:hemolysin III family protein [Gemmatimonadaceae bacterium]
MPSSAPRPRRDRRPQTLAEERANAVSHGAAFIASLAAIPVLVLAAAQRHDPWQLTAGVIYGVSMALLYLASTVYHLTHPASPRKHHWRAIDHAAIYVLIAGTYTPFLLGALRGPWGWSLLVIIWSLAIAGIAVKLGRGVGFRYPRLSTALYLAMGWLALVAIGPLLDRVGDVGLGWLLAGGVCYTAGTVFYVWERLRFSHLIWHCFVVAGSACHFVSVLGHAAGRTAG